MLLSAIFQLYRGDQFLMVEAAGVPGENPDPGQANGKLYHLRLRVECTLVCNLQSWARTHTVLACMSC
jgi:hypothetical protein